MYTDKVIEHFSQPQNAGMIEDADGIGEVGNPVFGDMMTFYIKVKDNKIADVIQYIRMCSSHCSIQQCTVQTLEPKH